MARFAHPIVLDAALAVVAAADLLVITAEMPRDFAEARADGLAEFTLTAQDFALASGVGGTRQLQVNVRAPALAMITGVAAHVALLDSASSRLVFVTGCASQPVLAGQNVQVMQWNIAIGAPL